MRRRHPSSSGPEHGPAPSGPPERALSPVVGTVLLVAIVVLLGTVTAGMLFDLRDRQASSPNAALALESTETPGEYELVHHSGDPLVGEQVRVRGVVNSTAVGTRVLSAGESVLVDPYQETVRVVWYEENNGSSYVVAKFDVDETDPVGGIGGFGATVFTGSTSGIKKIQGDGQPVTTIAGTSGVAALGEPDTDVTGNGNLDIPYVTSSDEVRLVDPDGTVTTVATNTDIPGSVESDKTRLAAGAWNGSDQSVLFVNENHDTVYRAAPGESPTTVATPNNGVQAVVGIADVDDDGTVELVFADGSQQLRYLEPSDGTTHNVADGQTGSNVGIGSGSLADLDGDGTPEVVAVDGGQYVKVVDVADGTATTLTANVAEKSPSTPADVDGDGSLEVVFLDGASHELRYVDDVGGSNTVRTLTDETGTPVGGSDGTGVT